MATIKNHVLESKNERITSYFSSERKVTLNGYTIYGHNGIDLIPEGYITTPEAGVVTYVKDCVAGVDTTGNNDFGNNVKIKVNDKYMIRFCHLKKGINLKTGDKINAGERVGYMGTTGFSTGVHLHFGLYDISSGTEIAIDPLPYLEGSLCLTSTGKAVQTAGFKVGDRVKVNAGAKDYNGGGLASFVYLTVYNVMSVSGDRVVIGINGEVTAAVKDLFLTLVSPVLTTAADLTAAETNLKKGDKVKVEKGRTAYDGAALASFVYNTVYVVMETGKNDRIVIGDGENVTAAVRKADLRKV